MSEHDEEELDEAFGDASRNDGWRGLVREQEGPPRIKTGKDLFLHCLESAGLVFVASLVAAGLPLHRVIAWQLVTLAFACLTAVTFYTAYRTTRSAFMSSYLLAWGVLLTVWFTAAWHFGVPHEMVIAGLFIPCLILAGIGPVAIGHHRQALARQDEAALGRANELEIKRWVRFFANHGAPGVKIIDVREEHGVIEVRGELGRATRDRRAMTYRQLEMCAAEMAVSLKRDSDGVYFSKPERGHAADFVLHVRPKRHGARPTVHMPLENKPLTVNRPLEFGVFDNGKPFRQLMREVHVLIGGSTGWGKALACDTPVPVPAGWATMGEIRPGDLVFDETGNPVRVLAATEVMEGRPCYEVEFSDGTVITADAWHQWKVDTAASRASRQPRHPVTLTTEQMIPGLRDAPNGRLNYSVRVAAPLQCPEADLPVPPYTLGAWLGDGTSDTGLITSADHEIINEIESEGETAWVTQDAARGVLRDRHAVLACLLADERCSPSGEIAARGLCRNHWERERRAGRLDQWPLMRSREAGRREVLAGYRIGDLTSRLGDLGMLENKHIPAIYQRASESQRRALLAGLLDTDGYCIPSGTAKYYSTCERLARDVHQLACGLGYKATLRSKTAKLYGKDCGLVWIVAFTPADKVFRLPRKLARQKTDVRPVVFRRYVTAIRPVPSVPVRCLMVDGPSHLYLAGHSCVPTHNSSLLNVFIALLAACPDSLIWLIDMSGGITARPWIMPYLAEHANKPVIDWVATERDEAKLMLESALEVGRVRSTYPVFEKITPSEATPALFLLCDDMGACFGHGKVTGSVKSGDRVSNWGLSQLGSEFTELARKAAGSMVGAVQRTNVELMGGTGIKAMSDIRFGLHCNDSVDGGRIFPDDPAAARMLYELQDRGDALIKRPGGITPVVHLYRIEPEERITDRALYCGNLRPKLEPQCAERLPAYAGRWDRNADLLDTWREAAGFAPAPDPEDEFGSIVAFNKLDDLTEPPGGTDPREKRMLQLIREAGWTGLYVRQIMSRLEAEGKAPARETVQRWLAKNAQRGKLHRPARGSGWRWANLGDDDDMPDVM